jgi:hypothetical protein
MLRRASFEDAAKFHATETLKIVSEKFRCIGSEVAPPSYVLKMLMKYGFASYPTVLYVACRLQRPEIVIETGAGAGLASAFILQALEENDAGVLCSIDNPRSVYFTEGGDKIDEKYWIPLGKETGWLVPTNLKKRWKLLIGKSSEILPKIIKEYSSVDIFFHDSEHTYQNMIFEYSKVYPCLQVRGLLLSHDIEQNSAFNDFCNSINVPPVILTKGLGLIIKK